MKSFTPHLEILPDAQRRLWSELRPAAELGFALYGGTAIALRLGHRSSIDFDFFKEGPLSKTALQAALPFLRRAEVLQESPDTYTVLVADELQHLQTVKLSFFGGIDFGRVGDPEWTNDGIVQAASVEDLLATKLKVVLQRVEAKDYIDIAALLKSGVRLERGLAAARGLFGLSFQPSECLKALVYFEGGDLEHLKVETKESLILAVRDVRDLPHIEITSKCLILV